MPSSNVNIPAPLQKAVTPWISTRFPKGQPVLYPLAGDGSTRQFFRLQVEGQSWVILWEPGWDLSKDYAAHQRYLKEQKLPVPAFEYVAPDAGFLVMEDLGDELLQARIQTESDPMPLLTRAVMLLADLHGRCFPVPPTLPVSSRRFDRAKYAQELAYTHEHLVTKLLHLKEPPSDVSAFCQELETLGPTVFCHRDYHTRNILFTRGNLVLIDFQDARLGSPHYDLASLIYDPYVPTTDTQRQALVSAYQKQLNQYALGELVDWDKMVGALALVGFQRMVKAAGSFASFFNQQGKSTHLPYLLPALKTARDLEEKHPVLGGIFPLALWIDLLEGMEAESL